MPLLSKHIRRIFSTAVYRIYSKATDQQTTTDRPTTNRRFQASMRSWATTLLQRAFGLPPNTPSRFALHFLALVSVFQIIPLVHCVCVCAVFESIIDSPCRCCAPTLRRLGRCLEPSLFDYATAMPVYSRCHRWRAVSRLVFALKILSLPRAHIPCVSQANAATDRYGLTKDMIVRAASRSGEAFIVSGAAHLCLNAQTNRHSMHI